VFKLKSITAVGAAASFVLAGLWGYSTARLAILEPELPGLGRVSVPSRGVQRASYLATRDRKSVTVGGDLPQLVSRRDTIGLEEYLTALAWNSPESALEAILELPDHMRGRALEVVLREWSASTPDQAWAFIAAHYPGFFATADFASAIAAAGRFDLAAAALNRLITADAKRQACQHLFPQWSAHDLGGFLDWARRQHGEIRHLALAESAATAVAGGGSITDWVSELPLTREYQTAWQRLVSRLVELNGYDRASQTISELPESAALWPAYSQLARAGDFAQTQAWLAKIEDPQARTLATISSVIAWTDRDIAFAARLSTSTGNVAVMRSQLTRIVPQWAARDPLAALKFLETAPIDNALRVELQQSIRAAIPNP
jgi:hypothetical protein